MTQAIEPVLTAINTLSQQIDECDTKIEKTISKDPDAQLLMTVPGVGPIVAACYLMAVRDPNRFSSGRDVGSYLGLVPSLYQSGETHRRSRITVATKATTWFRGDGSSHLAYVAAMNTPLKSSLKTFHF